MRSREEAPPKSSKKSLDGKGFLKEMLGFAALLVVAVVIGGIVFLLLNMADFTHDISAFLQNAEFWFYVLFYGGFFGVFVLWVKGIKKKELRPLFLSRPRRPEKEHCWFYIAYITVWSGIVITLIILMVTGIVVLPVLNPFLTISLVYGVIEAPIVEEIIFRGYIYARAEEVWDRRHLFFTWKLDEKNAKTRVVQTKRIMSFEVTYPALASSILFGIYHVPSYGVGAVVQFIGGLLFCKARNEWGNTLVAPMLFHSSWNLLAGAFQLGILRYIATPANEQLLSLLETILVVGIILILGFVFLGHYIQAKRVKWLVQLREILIGEKIKPYLNALVRKRVINIQQAGEVEKLAIDLIDLIGTFIEQATPQSLLLYYISSLGLDSPELLDLSRNLFGRKFRSKAALNAMLTHTSQDQIDAAMSFWGEQSTVRCKSLMRLLREINGVCDSIEILRQLKNSFSIKNIASDLPGVLEVMTGLEAFDELISLPDLEQRIKTLSSREE